MVFVTVSICKKKKPLFRELRARVLLFKNTGFVCQPNSWCNLIQAGKDRTLAFRISSRSNVLLLMLKNNISYFATDRNNCWLSSGGLTSWLCGKYVAASANTVFGRS